MHCNKIIDIAKNMPCHSIRVESSEYFTWGSIGLYV